MNTKFFFEMIVHLLRTGCCRGSGRELITGRPLQRWNLALYYRGQSSSITKTFVTSCSSSRPKPLVEKWKAQVYTLQHTAKRLIGLLSKRFAIGLMETSTKTRSSVNSAQPKTLRALPSLSWNKVGLKDQSRRLLQCRSLTLPNSIPIT